MNGVAVLRPKQTWMFILIYGLRMRKLILLLFLILEACSPCGNDPIHAAKSPDQKKVAIAFVRNCGATTDYSTHVSILDAPGKLGNDSGNILILKGKRPISVDWVSNKKLVVSGTLKSESFLPLTSFNGISVDYK